MRAAYEILRLQFAQVFQEWNDIQFYENFLNLVGEECSTTKCYIEWKICYAQK